MKFKNRVLAVLLVVVMTVLSAFVPSYSVSAENLNEERTYYVFGSDGAYEKSYTLSAVSNVSSSSSASTTAIVGGTDDTYPDYTKSGVVKIYNSAGTMGTGFVVDEHIIATAAHVVYSAGTSGDNSKYPTSILFHDSDGNVISSETITDIVSTHIPYKYITTGGTDYDYALIEVEEDLSDYMCFNLGVTLDSFDSSEATVYVTGYANDGKAVSGEGVVTTSSTDYRLYYTADTISGMSGGPVYIETTFNGKTYYTVVGVHHGGVSTANYGARMNTTLMQFYLNNPNL